MCGQPRGLRGNAAHINTGNGGYKDVSSSPAKIQHGTNRAVNPIHDKPVSRLYHSLPGEPSGVALAKKAGSEMNPSKSGLI